MAAAAAAAAASLQGTVSAAERSMRSVFVGNIPYEATEEQLKDIFSEVGPVVSFRLVYDRETGKPKGYGFCEYKDQETALSAMRNLNGYELNGRPLRVDNAASEKSKEELKNLQASMGGLTNEIESPYGAEIEADHAPEAISKAVASLPPEQMFELMKQMKLCIQNNPNEARNMLLQNPQLAYALLQAQVIMRIVDPQVALGMLHRQNPNTAPLLAPPDQDQSMQNTMGDFSSYSGNFHSGSRSNNTSSSRPALLGDRPTTEPTPVNPVVQTPMGIMNNQPSSFQPMDTQSMGDLDMRSIGSHGDRDLRGTLLGMSDRDLRQPMGDQDMRSMNQDFDPRFRNSTTPQGQMSMGNNQPNLSMMGGNLNSNQFNQARPSGGFDPRSSGGFDRTGPMNPARPEDPRSGGQRPQNPSQAPARSMAPGNIVHNASATAAAALAAAAAPRASGASGANITAQDQEKAALIMQVLALSDQQIAMLPAEQRQSILILKEQIARSAQN